jgi:hypothetical protein
MPLTRQDRQNAKVLAAMMSMVKEMKKRTEARRSVPRISLRVDAPWCRQNPGEAARRITALTDALMRTIAHCDAAKHKTDAYRNERDSILESLRAPKDSSH